MLTAPLTWALALPPLLSKAARRSSTTLTPRGEQVRKDTATPDIARSVSDMFEQAGGTISDLTERLGTQGETAAQRVLDELILARVRVMTAPERTAFLAMCATSSIRSRTT